MTAIWIRRYLWHGLSLLCLVVGYINVGCRGRGVNVDSLAAVKERVVYRKEVQREQCFIVISKRDMSLWVYEDVGNDTLAVAAFPVCLSANRGQKVMEGDMKTPECVLEIPFIITEIVDASTWFHDFDDGRGSILAYGAWFLRLRTGFSGIGIHGSTNNEETIPGRASEGCIRMRDEDIIFLKEQYAFVGMKVIVKREDEGLLGFERQCLEKITTAQSSICNL